MEKLNLPEIQYYGNLELLAHHVVEGFITGLHKSPFHGFSVEFAEHRLYNTGEPTRHIDWKLYGRSDKLFVKRYEEETNLRCQIVMDISGSMFYPISGKGEKKKTNKLEFSAYCAASLTYLLKRQRDAVGLSIFSDMVEVHTGTGSTTRQQKMIFHELEKILALEGEKMKKRTSAAAALHQIADNIHKRSLVVIFSDMLENTAGQDELFSALQHLRHNKHEVILFHVVDKQHEIDFKFENRPYIFTDMETGEEVKVSMAEVKEQYVRAMQAYRKDLELRCGQYRIDFVEADIALGYKQVLMPYMMKREKMK